MKKRIGIMLKRHKRSPQGDLFLTGFTLVELLLAASIFIALMMGLYSAFRTGIFSYARIDESLSLGQEVAQIFDRLNLDLRNSFSFSPDLSKFSGSPSDMTFLTLVDTSENASIENKYSRVSYTWADRKLVRLTRRDKQSLDEKTEANPEEMASNIEDCVFSYSGFAADGTTLIWKSAWEDLKAMPLAIKIKLTIKEKETVEFERTIYLPTVTILSKS